MSAEANGTRTSWIIRNEAERQRFREIHARLVPINSKMLLVIVVAMAPAIVTTDNVIAILAALGGVAFFGAVQRIGERMSRPEVLVLFGLIGSVVMIVVALAAYDTARSPALLLCAWTICGIAGRFNDRVVAISVAITAVAMEIAIIAPDPSVLWTSPIDVTLPPVALIAVWTACTVHRDSDLASRGAAVVDQLTGLLNRTALNARIEELEHQSRVTGEPVGLVVLDLDHFKLVNDTHGHTRGDEVLRGIGELLRRETGVHDATYRIGGEELVVVLPARGLSPARVLAERLRDAVAAAPIADLPVRASLGVAASEDGRPFVWDDVFARADAALYEAKRAGRDRVVVAEPPARDAAPRHAA